MSILDIIKPIQLLKGSHSDTAQTGQGCFMNVVAYLNGDDQITDSSPCVCVAIKPIIITLNDRATDEQRQQLVPYIERAMGSATTDTDELRRRVSLVIEVAKNSAAGCAAENIHIPGSPHGGLGLKSRIYHVRWWIADAEDYLSQIVALNPNPADFAAHAALTAMTVLNCTSQHNNNFVELAMQLLDQVLPPAQPTTLCVIERAKNLININQPITA